MKRRLSSTLCPLPFCPLYVFSHVCPVLMVIFALLPVLEAEVHTLSEVSGHVGQEEVLLPCQFTPDQNKEIVTLIQWDLQAPGDNTIRLVVREVNSSKTFIHESYKNKVDLKEYSLVIKNLKVQDAGVYLCTLTTYPKGSLPETRTKLVVNGQMPLSAGVVSAIVISVILLLGLIASTLYFIIRRRAASSRNHISIDTEYEVRDLSRPSFIKTEDVIYADVELQPYSRNRAPSLENHVTYSEVNVIRTRWDEPPYAQVMRI
ncbi:hypothetical protein WMY93_026470 [Mugilogobius chulae]|uniref:Ig-like domain-containing protein n=1 Tax=Mugilogobius chulae TaxID=88201 RepID=A0AAW0N106_9GOBI